MLVNGNGSFGKCVFWMGFCFEHITDCIAWHAMHGFPCTLWFSFVGFCPFVCRIRFSSMKASQKINDWKRSNIDVVYPLIWWGGMHEPFAISLVLIDGGQRKPDIIHSKPSTCGARYTMSCDTSWSEPKLYEQSFVIHMYRIDMACIERKTALTTNQTANDVLSFYKSLYISFVRAFASFHSLYRACSPSPTHIFLSIHLVSILFNVSSMLR